MKKLRVIVLMHEDLVPPDSLDGMSEEDILYIKTEYDVVSTLHNLGHEVMPVGVSNDLSVLRRRIEAFDPNIIFNLLEEFHGESLFDQHIVSYLELIRQAYTGCNPRGLTLAHDKALSKKICMYHRILVPKFAVYPRGLRVHRPKDLPFPLIVKSLTLEGSIGIAKASVVHSDEQLRDRVRYMHNTVGSDAIAEQFIPGRELYVGVLGNRRYEVFPPWELLTENVPASPDFIATDKLKWDLKYRERLGVTTRQATDLPDAVAKQLPKLIKRICKALYITGYARMDLRLTEQGELYLLEANPNPDLSFGEDFAESAEAAGYSYEQLISRLVSLGLRYRQRGNA